MSQSTSTLLASNNLQQFDATGNLTHCFSLPLFKAWLPILSTLQGQDPSSPCGAAEREIMNKSERIVEFAQLLLESIDESIRIVLGSGPWQSFFYRLEKSFNLRREEIAQRPQDFQKALEQVLGLVAAGVMTHMIIRTLCGKLQVPYQERRDWNFKTYVEDCNGRYKEKHG